MTKQTGKARRLVYSGLMILGTLIVCFGILELGLARFYAEKQSGNWSEFHPVRGWTLVPGDYLIKPASKFGKYTIHISDPGLRGHLPLPGPGKRRPLLVVGDSFTFAKETRTERMFTQRLQTLLEEWKPGVFEVLNAGVPGYGTAQQLLLMRELHEKHGIEPSLYVLIFFTNDILDNLCLSYGNLTPQLVRPLFSLTEDGRTAFSRYPENKLDNEADDTLKAGVRSSRLKSWPVLKALAEEWLQPRPKLVRFLGRIGIRARMARKPALLNGWYHEDIVSRGLPLTKALIREMDEEARRRGGHLLVSMVPSPLQVYPKTYIPLLQKSFRGDKVIDLFLADMHRPQRLVERLCREANIPFQDLLPVFLEQNRRTLFIPKDGHLNNAGHELAAMSLFHFIISSEEEAASERR